MRKAFDEMEGERLISRRQGRGTFVIDQTSDECAIRFSNIRDPDGIRIAGSVESCEIVAATANEAEARMLICAAAILSFACTGSASTTTVPT